MRMMGLRNTVHWLAWFLTTFVQMTVTVLTLTLMLKLGHVLEHSNALIVFLVLELFAVTSIMFS
jgi:ATP-binding cassette subfamily A (ABC1) protein 2